LAVLGLELRASTIRDIPSAHDFTLFNYGSSSLKFYELPSKTILGNHYLFSTCFMPGNEITGIQFLKCLGLTTHLPSS
jgi:hypothetical protein